MAETFLEVPADLSDDQLNEMLDFYGTAIVMQQHTPDIVPHIATLVEVAHRALLDVPELIAEIHRLRHSS